MPLLLALAFVALWAVWFAKERNRRRGLLALAAKLNLEIDPEDHIAPDPDIRGFVFGARYKRYLQGRIRGVDVVAFDYEIGWNRRGMYGTCVGVHRSVLAVPSAPRDLVLSRDDGWSFLFTTSTWRAGRRLSADEIERLWDQMLTAPANGMERASLEVDVPGGIVIRPVKRAAS